MSIRRRFIQDEEDLTFIFHLKNKNVGRIEVYCNNLESKVSLDEISKRAEKYYIQQLIAFTKQKLQKKQSA